LKRCVHKLKIILHKSFKHKNAPSEIVSPHFDFRRLFGRMHFWSQGALLLS
jgi:hypothetical protein